MKVKKMIATIIAGLGMIGSTSYMPSNTNLCPLIVHAEEGEKEMSVWDGTTYDTSWYDEDETEFHLESAAQFAGLIKIANSGKTMANKTIFLDVNVDLNSKQLESIRSFEGKFDGQNHEVRSLLNAFVENNSGNICNCIYYLNNTNFKYTTFNSANNLGGICNVNKAIINNCQVYGFLKYKYITSYNTSSYNIGGICGFQSGGCIKNCVSFCNIGGDCRRDIGIVKDECYRTYGGICGRNENSEIINCISNGEINIKEEVHILLSYIKDERTGPIRELNKSGTYDNNYYQYFHIAKTNFSLFIGGISGFNTDATIANCKNTNSIIYDYSYDQSKWDDSWKRDGGREGSGNTWIIYKQNATEALTSEFRIGGICGIVKNSTEISNCCNYGDIKHVERDQFAAGSGICDLAIDCNITDVYNRGKSSVGICSSTKNCTISNAYNTGKASYGITSSNGSSSEISNCYYSSASATQDGVASKAKTEKAMMTEEFAKLLGENFVYVPDSFPLLKWELSSIVPELSEKSITINDLNKKPQLQLEGIVLGQVTWMSSDTKIATVDNDGIITPISNGKTTIYAICGDSQAVCEVTVNAYTIDQKQITLTAKENAKINIKQNETLIDANKVSFVSSDPKIATVDKDGTIKSIAEGTCTITATIEDVELSCEVTVNKKEDTTTTAPPSPTIDKPTVSIKSGEKSEIKIMNYSGDITWVSSDTRIATVTKGKNNTATIEGIAAGSAKIYAMISGGKNLTCEVEVSEDGEANIKYGDANCDGTVDLSDAVIIMQSISNPSKFGEKGTDKTHITTQGQINGDVSGNKDGLTNKDALAIQKYMLQLITTLPE